MKCPITRKSCLDLYCGNFKGCAMEANPNRGHSKKRVPAWVWVGVIGFSLWIAQILFLTWGK